MGTKASKKSTITIEMDIEDAYIVVCALNTVAKKGSGVLEAIGGEEETNLAALNGFLAATRSLV